MSLSHFDHQMRRRLKSICLTGICILFCAFQVLASDDIHDLKSLIAAKDAVLLASPEGDMLFRMNASQKEIPASTLKVLTSLAAIHYLGENFRFPTDFFLDEQSNLIIKGYGDPLLISEEIQKIAAAIQAIAPHIHHILLDDAYFQKTLRTPGTAKDSLQPYDAPNGALCVNFNTVNFKIENQQILSAEPQTPMVDIARQKIMGTKLRSGRILLAHNGDEITRYAGQLFAYFLEKEGVKISGDIQPAKPASGNAKLIYRHLSTDHLSETIAKLLKYSNNFIANQLLLAAGAKAFGPPASMEKGVAAVKKYARDCLDLKNLDLVEGSGISRSNRLTAEMFFKILRAFKPYHMLMPQQENEYYKTGTLDGIRTRVGYLVGSKKKLYPFAVFINTPGKTPDPVMKILKRLID